MRTPLNRHENCLGMCGRINVPLNRFGYCESCQDEIDEDAKKNGATYRIKMLGSSHFIKAKDHREAIKLGLEEHIKTLREAEKDGTLYAIPSLWKPVKQK